MDKKGDLILLLQTCALFPLVVALAIVDILWPPETKCPRCVGYSNGENRG